MKCILWIYEKTDIRKSKTRLVIREMSCLEGVVSKNGENEEAWCPYMRVKLM